MCDTAVSELAAATRTLQEIARGTDFSSEHAIHRTNSAIEALCAALAFAEVAKVPKPVVKELTAPAREVLGMSPFVRRIQTWPRGYPGDFETIEYLVRQVNKAEVGTMGHLVEQFCLGGSISQQHRNKVRVQAAAILRTIMRRTFASRTGGDIASVLVLAAGSSPDLAIIEEELSLLNFRIVLNDSDSDAIEFSLRRLPLIGDRLIAVRGNAIRRLHEIRQLGPYDLVVAGGLFDYLDSRWAGKLISMVFSDWLAPGGSLLFTNIAHGNPYRMWMECMADWPLRERTELELIELISRSAPGSADIRVYREETSLALIAQARAAGIP